jgi:hypothetical protein
MRRCTTEGGQPGRHLNGCLHLQRGDPPGGVPLPLTQSVTGYDLRFAADIQAAASAGLVILIDTGTVIIGTAGPSS